MLLLILAVWYGYKKARDTGRNKFLWAAVSGGVFLGIQFGVGLAWGIFAVAAEQMWGSDLASGTAANLIVSVVAVVLSVIGLMLVFRFVYPIMVQWPRRRRRLTLTRTHNLSGNVPEHLRCWQTRHRWTSGICAGLSY